MKLKVASVSDALHPDQVSVSIHATDGDHFVVLNRLSLVGPDRIDVGAPLARRGQEILVELPAETDGGAWRLWVDKNSLSDYLEAAE